MYLIKSLNKDCLSIPVSANHISIYPFNILGTGQPNSSHSNRDRAAVGNNGAKISAALSDTSHSHQEVMRSSSSSAALVNANNTENSSKCNYYQMHQNIQKSTGTSSITSDSVTGIN